MASTSEDELIRDYSKALNSGNAGVFVGAGLSKPAGFVDWRNLLREIALDLALDVDRESDLIAVAQFHVNERRNRAGLNDKLIHEFTKEARISENHQILARLPLSSIWTTNYDTLIEDAVREAGRIPDVKITQESLAQTRPGRDVVVYKMHGDASQPQNAVLTKDDYERFESTHRLFVESLKGDLVSTTFLFLGFSFTDPNIDYVLSRIRVLLGENQRTHYCLMRRPPRPKDRGKTRAEYDYEVRRLQLRIEDLKRFAIQTVLVDEYDEVTELLREISKRAHRRNIFVSGSARDYGPFGEQRLLDFARLLGHELITHDYNLVSGFGRGLGDQVILGALEGVHDAEKGRETNRTIIRPFPRASAGHADQAKANTRHREDLISQSGAVIFLCGNREYQGTVDDSIGVLEEFQIAKQLGRFPVPVGCTGFAAEHIWNVVMKEADTFFPMRGVRSSLKILGDASKSNGAILRAVLSVLDRAIRHD